MKSPGRTNKQQQESRVHRILVASDLTAKSDRAFDRALILARQSGSELQFLHVIDPKLLPERYVESLLSDAQARLEREVREGEIENDVPAFVKVVSGRAENTIVNEASSMEVDLIVMGLSGDATLAGLIRGTTIDKVVRRALCPVLVVKTRARRPYSHITAAVDTTEPSRRALDFALRAFPSASFSIIHVDETARPDKDARHDSTRVGRQHQVQDLVTARFTVARVAVPEIIFTKGKVANALQEEIARLRPDLVVIGTHTRTGVAPMFLGSVARTLLEVLPTDILVQRT